jgi:hypothetical protein
MTHTTTIYGIGGLQVHKENLVPVTHSVSTQEGNGNLIFGFIRGLLSTNYYVCT